MYEKSCVKAKVERGFNFYVNVRPIRSLRLFPFNVDFETLQVHDRKLVGTG